MINRLPWRKKLRTSAANNLDKINEIVDYINHSDISPVLLSEYGSGRSVTVGVSSSLKSLDVYGESIQDGTPTPDAPVEVQVVEGRNLANIVRASGSAGAVTEIEGGYRFTVTSSGNGTFMTMYIPMLPAGSYYFSVKSSFAWAAAMLI